MRLSDAIRLGAMLKPQAIGDLLSEDCTSSCAIGAALDAIGALDQRTVIAISEWPLLQSPVVACPACHSAHLDDTDLYDNITTLNDVHEWTRERIADWIEGIERSL